MLVTVHSYSCGITFIITNSSALKWIIDGYVFKKFLSKLCAEVLVPKDHFCLKYPIDYDVIYTID